MSIISATSSRDYESGGDRGMADCKKLFDEGRYFEALKESEGTEDPSLLFLRLSCLIRLGKNEEALKELLKNRASLFSFRPLMAMKSDFELRFALKEFDEAYEDLSYFSNLPYVSQEVEEALRSYPKIIRAEEKASLLEGTSQGKSLSLSLSSKDPYAVLGALSQIGKQGIAGYEKQIEGILVSALPHDVRAFALEVLVACHYPKEVRFDDGDEVVSLLPSALKNPFEEENYQNLRKMLLTLQDASLSNVCLNLADQLSLSCYPSFPFAEKPLSLLTEALLSLGREYLGDPETKEEAVEEEKKRLKALLAKHPPLP